MLLLKLFVLLVVRASKRVPVPILLLDGRWGTRMLLLLRLTRFMILRRKRMKLMMIPFKLTRRRRLV